MRGLSRFFNKTSAYCLAILMACTAVCNLSGSFKADYVDDISQLEQRQSELEEERKKLEVELAEYQNNADEQEEYLKIYDEKMSVQEEEMNNITEQIKLLDQKIKELDEKIALKQVEVDEGVEEFRNHLRIMYINVYYHFR